MKIALTGGIGSGKSFVCKRLAERGIRVYDCDAAAKRLIRTSEEIKTALTSLIGNDTYTADGQLNKALVAQYLLASDANAQAINCIVHPAVARDFIESGETWMECAILYESGFDRLVDKVIAIVAPTELRIRRIMERDGLTEQKANEWISKQMPQAEVAAKADYKIINDEVHDVDKQINEIINILQTKQCYRQS